MKKADWKKHERDVAARAGGRVTRGSGAVRPTGGTSRGTARGIGQTSADPGDVRDNEFIRECKATVRGSLSIQLKWLKGLVEQALVVNRRPILEIRFEQARPPVSQDWVLMPAEDFDELLERAGGKSG